jgi:predicted transcriptional regulator
MKYRSRTEIIAAILRVAHGSGATKTRIMYGAYLSYSQLVEYLNFLTKRDLLFQEEGTSMFKLTQKGIDFLRTMDRVQNMLDTDELGNKIQAAAL